MLRRIRNARLARTRCNPSGGRPPSVPKPWNASVPGGYPTYYQTAPPPPPPPAPVHTPQYPPRGYEYHGHSQSRRVPPSPIQSIPQPTTARLLVSTRAPSGTTSRPVSSVDHTPLSVRSSVHRNEPATFLPSNPSSSSPLSSSRSTQPPHPPHSSPPPRSPSVAVLSVASSPPQRLSAATSPRRNPPPSLPLTSMNTGASYSIDEPPPAYTPI